MIPVDDAALDAIEHAITGTLSHTDDNGDHLNEARRIGADFGLPQLLDFWAGVDANEEGILTGYGFGDLPIYEDDQPSHHPNELIQALVTEIRRLRSAS